jgi:uncharacterized protein
MKKLLSALAVGAISLVTAQSQILLSGGLTYSQNFDSLSNAAPNATYTWTDNAMPGMTGWYASRAFSSGTTSAYGPYVYPSVRIGDGSQTSGWLYSFGVAGVNAVEERSLGSTSSGTPKTNVFGLRLQNDTATALDTVTISYTGEQWRNGGNTAAHKLAFSFQVNGTAFASPIGVGDAGWTSFSSLDFTSPVTGASAAALDGNAAANRTLISGIVLTGVTVNPGEEIFLRWLDIDDSGNDHGLAVDDFSVRFSVAIPEPATGSMLGLAILGLFMRLRNRR